MEELASQSLELVSRELASTLETARGEIEDFVDGQSDSEALVRAASMLHLASGALKIVEIHGAALLAEEMEQTCLAIHASGKKPGEDAAEALTRAMVQLPAYLERLMSGGSDVALVLLPLLNDLRDAQGKPMLSEGTLLLLNSGPFERFRGARRNEPARSFGKDVPVLAQRLRPKFQSALLKWIRGEGAEACLDELIEVCDAIEVAAESDPVRQLWAVTAGVLTALREGHLEPTVQIKRLLGQADRQLKRLIDAGEQAFFTAPPVELLNSLLYYVARAPSQHERLVDLRRSFGLEAVIPDAAEIEQAREDLAGPSVRLMRTVAEAIREDLGQVKDVLDIFVRTGMENIADLMPQLDMLKKIGDTLGVLGIASAREQIQTETAKLAAIVAEDRVSDPSVLEGMAASLLDIEDMLDRELISAGRQESAEAESDDQEIESTQLRHVTGAVMRECIINLARIKEAVVKVLEDPDSVRVLDQVEPQLRGIVAGLLMLNRNRAVNVIERIGRNITTRLAQGERLKPRLIERLADSIVAIEYYMETIALGRSDPFYMLDNANRCLDLIEGLAEGTGAAAARAKAAASAAQPEPAPADPEAEKADKPEKLSVMELDEDRSQPELVEIFIEEAKEELANIRTNLPRWLEQPQDQEALNAVRRSFHTLKGSGRVVGAQLLGEFAWSVENLLNRVINQTLQADAAIRELVQDAVALLPALIEQLEVGIEPATDVGELIARAGALAEGRSVATAPAPDEAAAVPVMDPVLRNIFVKEVREHLATIRAFIATARGRDGRPMAVSEPLHRACHTMYGSARMANCAPAIELAQPLERRIREAFEMQQSLAPAAIGTLDAFCDAIDRLTAALEAEQALPSEPELMARIEALPLAEAPTSGEDTGHLPQPDETRLQASPHDEESEAGDYDPEIAAIFCDEATELLDQAEMQLQALRQSDAAAEPAIAELKRLLHTLKGGARLAGIMSMGDLSHSLETMLPKLAADSTAADGAGMQLAQRTLDQLQQMRDTVEAGQIAPAARELLEQLENFGRAAPAEAVEPAGDAAEFDLPAFELDQELPEFQVKVELPPLTADSAEDEEAGKVEAEVESDEVLPAFEVDGPVSGFSLDDLDDGEAGESEETRLAPVIDFNFSFGDTGSTGIPTASDEASAAEPESVPESPSGDTAEAVPASGISQFEDMISAAFSASDAKDAASLEPSDTDVADVADVADDAGDAVAEADASADSLPVPEAETGAAADTEFPDAPPDAVEPAPAAPATAPEPPQLLAARAERADMARVDASLLDELLNGAGEISIFQSRLNQQIHSIEFHLGELGQTVTRLREQLRALEAETEAQILHRHQGDTRDSEKFDPLELDRYSTIQQLSRALAETSNDVASINELLQGLTSEADTLLTQQSRVTTDIQDGLMQTRMVTFDRHATRLARIVRQAAQETGKSAELAIAGSQSQVDRQILDAIVPALEHLLRNAVVHGIEPTAARTAAGKPGLGKIILDVRREGSEVIIDISDDGAGLDLKAIRRKAEEKGLIEDGSKISDDEVVELILLPGFSTADELTQSAGRGVGMDVVDNEVKRLGGSLRIDTEPGKGTRFLMRLPYTLAITHALIVNVGDESFAMPLPTVEGIARVRREQLLDLLTEDDPRLTHGDGSYRLLHLGSLVGAAPSALPEDEGYVSLVLVRAGEGSAALLTDSLEGSREVVVKTLGPHLAGIQGVTGATILGDGRVVVILDVATLVRMQPGDIRTIPSPVPSAEPRPLTALVVDDSITMRRVTQRLLERRGVKVQTARDGLDAIEVLREHDADIILLDVEMPRMDGYQFASHVRNDDKLRDTPIIMVTSRSGEKHRARAIEIGVNDYLSKPYQEAELVAAIEALLGRKL